MVVMTVAPTTSLSGVLFDISDQLFNKKKEYNPSCDIQKHRHDTTTQNKIKLRREPFVKSFESIYMHVHKVLQYMPLPPSKVTDFTGNYAFVHKISNESRQWEVLPPPPSLYVPLCWNRDSITRFSQGTFKINDKMIVINRSNDVVIYDAERNEWTTKELSTKDPFAQFSKINFTMDYLHVEENGLFDPSEHGHGISQIKDRKFCFIPLYQDDWHFS
ncbi:hypothetical protein V6N12_043526 [Hibiscus sabdariffa]|uniref:F-box protein n=1 Tax=Hibiscus sabdariffa TaxID=183260 RepID=A0ABR2DEL6_9ROSI